MRPITLQVYQVKSRRCLQLNRCPQRKREKKRVFIASLPWRNHQQLSHSFKKEAITAIWRLCSFLNRSRFKGADLASRLALGTFWSILAERLRCACHPPLLRFPSHPFLSTPSLLLWIRNEQGKHSLDWMRWVAWTMEGPTWWVQCWMRD